jgi:hypothetical protein
MIAITGINLFIIANTPLNQHFSLRFLKALSAVCSKCITLTQIFFAQHCSARALSGCGKLKIEPALYQATTSKPALSAAEGCRKCNKTNVGL